MRGREGGRRLVPALAALALACAAGPAAAAPGDPLEPMNRGLYAANSVFDRLVGRPLAMTWRRVVPGPLRRMAGHALGNLGEPSVAFNDLLQGRVPSAGRAAARFATNTTVGVLGVFDVAAKMGLAHHDNSFGDTLGRAGMGPGPYLFVPVVGPSTVRDLAGDAVDFFADPLLLVRHIHSRKLEITELGVAALDERAKEDPDLKELDATATDPYATLRSVYLQTTAARIRGDATPEALPDLPPETLPAAPAPSAAPAAPQPAPSEAPPPAPGEL